MLWWVTAQVPRAGEGTQGLDKGKRCHVFQNIPKMCKQCSHVRGVVGRRVRQRCLKPGNCTTFSFFFFSSRIVGKHQSQKPLWRNRRRKQRRGQPGRWKLPRSDVGVPSFGKMQNCKLTGSERNHTLVLQWTRIHLSQEHLFEGNIYSESLYLSLAVFKYPKCLKLAIFKQLSWFLLLKSFFRGKQGISGSSFLLMVENCMYFSCFFAEGNNSYHFGRGTIFFT